MGYGNRLTAMDERIVLPLQLFDDHCLLGNALIDDRDVLNGPLEDESTRGLKESRVSIR